MNLFIKSEGRQWPAHQGEIKTMFGLPRNAKWPAQGMPHRQIQGIWVWVDSLGEARANGRFHRMQALCPACHKTVPAGRLQQHAKVHT